MAEKKEKKQEEKEENTTSKDSTVKDNRQTNRRNNSREQKAFDIESWTPKTSLGKQVKDGEVTDLGNILDQGTKIMESQIVEVLLPNLTTELLLIGQAKGKFGGGQRRVFKQTQKKTREGNKPKFATVAIVGNNDGFIGVGYGKSKETVPAREKAFRNSKLNTIKIRRGCGSWKCGCGNPHSIPFKTQGKCGSTEITLMPAPKGTGLCIEKECAKILKLAGVKDVWSKTKGQTKTKINLIKACMVALRNLGTTKIRQEVIGHSGLVEGSIMKSQKEKEELKEILGVKDE